MKSITTFSIAIVMIFFSQIAYSQTKIMNDPAAFTGAKATLDHYKALYVINSSEEKRVKGALRNINNALEDPRLIGKLEVELVVFGDGVEVFKKGSPYEETLKQLRNKGVILAQCENKNFIHSSPLYLLEMARSLFANRKVGQ